VDPSGITQTLGLVKQAIKASSSLSNLEIKDALIAAREALNDQRETNLALRDENHGLKEKVAELSASLKKNEQIVSGVDCYERVLEDGQKFAICSKCWELNGDTISLKKSNSSYPDCPNCNNFFNNIQRGVYVNLSGW
jgi:hypothetical protein